MNFLIFYGVLKFLLLLFQASFSYVHKNGNYGKSSRHIYFRLSTFVVSTKFYIVLKWISLICCSFRDINKRKFEVRVLKAAIMAAMLSDLPYMEADITEHVSSVNFLYVKWLKSVKIGSFVPKLANGKRPVCLGQKEGKVKKLAGVFPITSPPSVRQSLTPVDSYITEVPPVCQGRCLHGSTCVVDGEVADGFRCQCKHEFTGKLCETGNILIVF